MALTAYQLANRVLMLLREQGFNPTPTSAPTVPTTGDYNFTFLLQELNLAQTQFVIDTGLAPMISEQRTSFAVTAGYDYALPANCKALTRVEYYATSFGAPVRLNELTFDGFDQVTSGGYLLADQGYPSCYRSPFGPPTARTIRLWPAPTAGNVSAGDQIILYYTSSGTTMVLGTDIPGIPDDFHEALSCWVLSKLWRRKQDASTANLYAADYLRHVANGKAYASNVDRAGQPSFADEEGVQRGDTLFPMAG